MIQVKIRLFGAFRNFGNGEFVEFEVPRNSGVAQVKQLFGQQLKVLNPGFNNSELIEDSVLASEDSVLDSHMQITSSCSLAILPPVCGG